MAALTAGYTQRLHSLPSARTTSPSVRKLPFVSIPGHTSMLLWASLLLLAPVGGQLEAASKPVISLHPPWTIVFKGETVTLTCNVFHFHAPEKIRWFLWYLGRRKLSETPENSLEVRDSGQYRCQTQDSLPSDHVSLTFSSGLLILQAPHSVFEGDTLVLRCRTKKGETLTSVKYSWNRKVISTSNQSQDLLIPHASSNNSGHYHCTGYVGKSYMLRSNIKVVHIQELFPEPKLKVTPSQPTEGKSVNLSCETQRVLERPDTVLHFIFFREHGVVLSDWSQSPELQITALWRQDSGVYGCGAASAQGVRKYSLPLQVSVQGVPVSGVLLETQPPEGRALAGEPLVLVCSAAEGTGDTTFSWYREDTGESLGRKRRRSQRAQLEIPAVGGSHAGGYFCTADNGLGLDLSAVLNVTVTGTQRNRSGLTAARAIGGLLSILLLAAGLLIYHRHRRKSGDGSPGNTTRSPPATGPGETPHGRCQEQKDSPVELQHLHGNVSLREGDLVYSEIQIIQLGQEGEASASRACLGDKCTTVVYSSVKTQLQGDSAGDVRSQDEDEDGYENVPPA
ncbi:Fc receptor-like protein 4 [Hyaena hyaena]|uniref:Fc receptor-like protein 4 n=1 Tax=Hyaena hyaena TaxID=95912 RepID=UPI0019229804|nr:Fc receptor-like protein 4 [Hyaena hyaena]